MGAYAHLVLNHLPVAGTLFALCLLCYSLWRRSRELLMTSFGAFIAVSFLAVPAYLSGEPAEEDIEHMAGVEERYIEAHEEFAEIAFVSVLFTGGVSIVALYLARKKPASVQKVGAILAIVATGSLILLAWTAKLGGEIRHPEARIQISP